MNPILVSDSYKISHWKMLPPNTTGLYSYFESRNGAKFNYTVFYGLQSIINKYLCTPITKENIDEAEYVFTQHFGGNPSYFNKEGWQYILDKYEGRLPLEIKAVPEGSVVPTGNVLMTVENTDPNCAWLTNYVETILTHVWYPSTVTTLSRKCKELFLRFANLTCDNHNHLDFQLHDFGYRGVSSFESAGAGGSAHLINFMGTDTLAAFRFLSDNEYTIKEINDVPGFSVAATEHSVMTAEGPSGEADIVGRLLKTFPTGILSVVADSYDIYNFVDNIVGKLYKPEILARDGIFVVRPDSITPLHDTPELLMKYILNSLWCEFDGTHNSKGYKVLNPKVRVIWGDGIDYDGIRNILEVAELEGFASENMIFGMGGGLLQKVNRDTQRFAFKCSAQKRTDGQWIDIFKQPRDESKASKKGRMKLVRDEDNEFITVPENHPGNDELVTVFKNGKLTKIYDISDVRENAKL